MDGQEGSQRVWEANWRVKRPAKGSERLTRGSGGQPEGLGGQPEGLEAQAGGDRKM